jgi:hypothetical protein
MCIGNWQEVASNSQGPYHLCMIVVQKALYKPEGSMQTFRLIEVIGDCDELGPGDIIGKCFTLGCGPCPSSREPRL